MAAEFSIDTRQLAAFAVQLDSAAGAVGARAAGAVRKTAADINGYAQTHWAVDTGFLKNSQGYTITGDGRFGQIVAEIGPTAYYGVYVELGTSRMAPEPALGPGYDLYAPDLGRALEEIGGTPL